MMEIDLKPVEIDLKNGGHRPTCHQVGPTFVVCVQEADPQLPPSLSKNTSESERG